ncbi:MAG: putative glycoside hydrolase/deacetylase ChbG (UPF0249 family) [Phenylobacterium sp.]|jgi:predicted glycoside hydrolase/deacetylase ChbG (UPF0249 family)
MSSKPAIDLNKVNVIFHVDDIGMFQSSIAAFSQLCANEKVLSGSLMAPCPWFAAATRLQQQFPQADLGLHLTLTSEWNDYRWGPVSPSHISDGLRDDSGIYFHQRTEQVVQTADVVAVENELRGQIELAKRLGFEPSHLDGHMYTCQQKGFLPIMLKLALAYQIQPVVTYDFLAALGEQQSQYWQQQLKQAGMSIFNQMAVFPLVTKPDNSPEKQTTKMREFLTGLPAGLHYIYAHPSEAGPELKAMSTRQANMRTAELQALLSLDLRALAASLDINLCTFQDLID